MNISERIRLRITIVAMANLSKRISKTAQVISHIQKVMKYSLHNILVIHSKLVPM